MSESRWIALHCGEESQALIRKHPTAFLLLTQIAMRARWKPCPIQKLAVGQAFIGDWREAGISSEKAYRHAKKILMRCELATFQGRTKGTVATLTNTMIYSLTNGARGGQTGDEGATKGQAGGGEGATKHKDTKEHVEHTDDSGASAPADFTENARKIVEAYPRREKILAAMNIVAGHLSEGEDFEAILSGTKAAAAVIRTLPSGASNRYVPSAVAFFEGKRWADDPETLRRQGDTKSGSMPMSEDEFVAQLGGRARKLQTTTP